MPDLFRASNLLRRFRRSACERVDGRDKPGHDVRKGPARVRTRVKICCIASVAEAEAAVAAGADAIGLVSAMPSGPGVIGEDLIAKIAARRAAGPGHLPAHVEGGARSHRRPAAALRGQHDPALRRARCRRLPGIARGAARHRAGAGDPRAGRACGGGGHRYRPHGRRAAARFRQSGRPGEGAGRHRAGARLGAQPAHRGGRPLPRLPRRRAQSRQRGRGDPRGAPLRVDLCTGVRTEGALDAAKLGAFMGAVAAADA